LWYFGYQGDGISAADILQNPNQANNQQWRYFWVISSSLGHFCC
jgi:hypothetical protein